MTVAVIPEGHPGWTIFHKDTHSVIPGAGAEVCFNHRDDSPWSVEVCAAKCIDDGDVLYLAVCQRPLCHALWDAVHGFTSLAEEGARDGRMLLEQRPVSEEGSLDDLREILERAVRYIDAVKRERPAGPHH